MAAELKTETKEQSAFARFFADTPLPVKLGVIVLCTLIIWPFFASTPPHQNIRQARSLEGSILAADLAEQQARPAVSAYYYAKAHHLQPHNLLIAEKLFLANLSAGRFERSIKTATTIVKLNTTHRMARLVLAVDAIKHDKPEIAITQIGALKADAFSALISDLIMQWAYYADGDVENALVVAARLMKTNSFTIEVAKNLALFYEAVGKVELAERAHQKVIKNGGLSSLSYLIEYVNFLHRQGNNAAIAQFFSKLSLRQQKHPIYAGLGEILAKSDKPTKPVGPLNLTASQGVASALTVLAQSMKSDLSLNHIAPYVEMAFWLDPENVQLGLIRGELAVDSEDYQTALDIYNSLSDDPLFGMTVSISAALVLEQQGELDEALLKLHELAALNPNKHVELSLADMYLRAELYAKAEPLYSSVIASLKRVEAQDWGLFFSRGMVRERIGDWKRAEGDLLLAKNLSKDNEYVLNYLGYSWIDNGVNLKAGLSIIEQAVKKQPLNGFFVDSLGWALYRLSDYENAVRLLEKAAELEPLDPEIIDHLGDALWRAERRFEARYQWQRALGLNPKEEKYSQLEEKIDTGLTLESLDQSIKDEEPLI